MRRGSKLRGWLQLRHFAAAGGNFFGRFDAFVADEESDIEIVDRGADVARQEIQNLADFRRSCAFCNGHR